jgi:hypothetical protein
MPLRSSTDRERSNDIRLGINFVDCLVLTKYRSSRWRCIGRRPGTSTVT